MPIKHCFEHNCKVDVKWNNNHSKAPAKCIVMVYEQWKNSIVDVQRNIGSSQ